MYLVTQAFILLLAIYLSNAGYGIPAPSGDPYGQSDVQAPAYVPPYLKNQRFGYGGTKTGYGGTKTGYGGTKTGYSGTKTGYGGTKSGHGYSGTKNPYSGTKSRYSGNNVWYSSNGVPHYTEFQNNANMPFIPKCEPGCKNMGICVDTNTCQCPANFHGKYCEFEKKPCLSYPPLPMNAERNCAAGMCTISCLEGHKFIDGSNVANMRCIDGQWQPTRADFSTIPDCLPECSPACENGGICLSVNVCQCPADFRGPQCQYSVSACDVHKLAFSGGFDCFGDSESTSCTLSCSSGSIPSSPLADLYTCRYATGVFEPQPIPSCVFPEVVAITPGSHRLNTTYSETSSESHSYEENISESQTMSHMSHVSHGSHGRPVSVVVQDFMPKGGTCLTWAGVHYKTFDGKIYSFQSPCQHILVRGTKEHEYSVGVKNGECKDKSHCPSELTVYLDNKLYVLAVGEDGSVLFRNTKRLIPMPASLPGIRVSMPSDHVVVNLDAVGVTIKWDTNNVILVEGSVLLWNNTEGLCGTLDGNPLNDFTTKEKTVAKTKSAFASSWQIYKIGEVCDSKPTETSACASKSDEDMKKAQQFCTKIFSKDKFRKCSVAMDVSLLLEACQWDFCACTTSLSPEECACSTVSVYAKECLRHGVEEMKDWRDADTCPMKCPEGKIYKACGPDTQASCAFPIATGKADPGSCVEGCFCPEGLLLEGGRCVPANDCPCRLRNRSFKPGATIRKDCNTCTCQAGSWICSAVSCGARCGAVGDPHYSTFDGLRYDFMGHCTYTMMQADNITVEVENVACSGSITEAMDLSPYKGEGKPSCTKAVTLKYDGATVLMKQGGFILVNDKEVSSLPVMVGDVRIRAASSMFVIVQLPNKIDLWWDGNTRVFIDVPAEFSGKTKGLCGTFNLNQKDDFLTPENDIEQSALAFANKWKTREFCSDIDTKEPEHPCKANIENKEAAEKYCSKLKSKLFEECRWYVDVEPYYEACLYDMCACAGDVTRCLCPVLGDYAMTCAKAGVLIQWRYNVPECELQCTGGQEYTVCADSCLRKCADMALSASGTCRPCCVEGCACPPGQLLDDDNVCVPTGLCPCFHKGLQFNAGYKEVRAGRRERELCTCVGARWDCKPATPMEIQNYPPAEDLRSNCSASNNMEFTTCEIAEPLTCKNMHLPPSSTTAECRPGCQCKKGWVLDLMSRKCVRPAQCPCHHGGRSYPDGHTMQEECNTCECKSGNWTCSQRKCAGVCAAWGDSHVVTFDGTDYDFEGVCTYLLAKGVMDTKDGFDVEIQNVPCGTTGATCSKSVTLKVGSGGNEEIVSLTKDAPIPDISKLKRIKMRIAGVYVFLDVPSLGMSLQWDRGMRVYVKVDGIWQGRVKGLCGNYNGDMRDDFQTPSGGGMAESSALIFADSWKLKPTCPKPQRILDHCTQRPERKEWASTMCSTMKQYPFTLCHAEVSPSPYIERCTRDACACDSGADCECACTALAAYAHACAHRGVTFKWRSQHTCPMQCDEECSNYDACLSPCPVETCDNTLYYSDVKTSCEQDTCVEGCKPKKSCPEGQVYKNSSHSDCVPRAKCKPVCMTLEDGRELAEGDVIEEDDCHTCRCSKKQRICTGQPCSTTAPPQKITTPKLLDEPLKCVTGWTPWVNRGPPEIGANGASIDNEPLPQQNQLTIGAPMCKKEMMRKIECRTVGDHKTPKETGLDVECSLERGLYCKEVGKQCLDFEIRVFCECEEPKICENSVRPNEPHPTDCAKFYECSPSGPVLKQCGTGTLYNPVTMICDWPASVALVRPECAATTPGALKTSITEATTLSTSTLVPSTSTYVPSTSTQAPSTSTQVPSTSTQVPSTSTQVPSTSTHVPSTSTQVPSTSTQVPSTSTQVPSTSTQEPSTSTQEPSTTNQVPLPTTSQCPPGQVYSVCAYRCDRLCDYFRRTLISKGRCIGETCVEGCLEESCDANSYWRDEKTCVPMKDCTCYADGKMIKPGGVVVDGCIKCQCLNNEFHCDSSECVVVETPVQGSTHQPIIVPHIFPSPSTPATTSSTTTARPTTELTRLTSPPPECTPDNYVDLLWGDEPLPESAFSASSIASGLFEPQYARLDGHPLDVTAGSWNPKTQDQNQYIQVELPHPEPIFGVVMQGSPLFDQYVTSYEVLYGDDKENLKTVLGADGKPKIFEGPSNNNTPKKQMIEPAIEAKVLRIRPLTWNEEIAVRFELIGCKQPVSETTKIEAETTKAITYNVTEMSSTTSTTVTTPTTPTTPTTTPTTVTTPTTPTTVTTPTTPATETTSTTAAATTMRTITSTPMIPTKIAAPLIISSTVSPPPECNPDSYINLMWGDQPLPNSAFSASSTASENYEPQYAKLNGHPLDTSAGSWNPAIQDTNQYIQVQFPQREPVYGVVLQGSPLFDQYVTSYHLLYGDDVNAFSTVNGPDGKPKVFRGPVDHNTPLKQMIEPPVEAKVFRVQPLTWHDEIAVRLELIGCKEPSDMETTRTTITPAPEQCTDPLGLGADLPLQSIEVSSNEAAREYFALDGERGWRPLYSTPGEWIMFNFTSPRNITAVKTKGGPYGWVTTYKIMYTSDLSTFNPVVDETGADKLFPGNFDKDTTVVSEFKPPIHAQYLKVLPISWKDNIEMRVEPIGCFEPYPITERLPELTTPRKPFIPKMEVTCELCPGVLSSDEPCDCAPPANYYDGENCVTRDQCPCVEAFMPYPVGSTFRGASCDECVCKLGGVTDCRPAKVCLCAPNLVPKLSSTCECLCEPCPAGTKICPTSKLCLPLDKWCDGLQDCPDDEKNCTTTSTTTITTSTTPKTTITEAVVVTTQTPATVAAIVTDKPPQCPKVECQRGYKVSYTTKPSSSRFTYGGASDLPPPRRRTSYEKYQRAGYSKGGFSKGGFAKGGYSKGGFSKGGYGLPPVRQPTAAFSLAKPAVKESAGAGAGAGGGAHAHAQECVQFRCVPSLPRMRPGERPHARDCPVPSCPPRYELKMYPAASSYNRCPQYECVPLPDRPVFCNVTGRTINTFDGTEYKYDICNHILARENRFEAWTVLVRKKCRLEGCMSELVILQDDQLITLKPNMMIEYDNYEYTVEQTSKICFQKNSFNVYRMGNGVAVKSRKYNFVVFFNSEGDIKIGVLKSSMGTVDGLCGAFDGEPRNDRRLPDGKVVANIDQFGRAWAKPGLSPTACQPKMVPTEEQRKALNLCSAIAKEPLSQCGGVLNLHKWQSICLEKLCECSELIVNGTRRSKEECLCLLLEQLVAECLAADKNVDLSGWRIDMNCPATCPAPLVHYDCYRKRCEPTCPSSGAVKHDCPLEDGQCFPGCYCPEGMLRKGDQCVLPNDCLDCSCNGVGTPAKYVTFEGDDLPFLGNCTYLASRDRNESGHHKYELYSTNGPCHDNDEVVCTKIVHLVYDNKVIHVSKDDNTNKLVTTIGEETVFKYPVKKDWVTIDQVNGQDVSILLPDIHVELTVLQPKMEFTVRVPSYQYANRTEGLCGVCLGYEEFLVTSNGTITDDFDEYGKSWQASPAALKTLAIPEQGECAEPQPAPECVLPPPESNPCYNLYNADRFGACHALVEPESFVEACEADLCSNVTDSCVALERYVAACRREGVCLQHWREDLCPYPCEEPLVYRACVNCEMTCENSEELTKNPEKCGTPAVEGCFCPEGKVRVNNTCIEPTKCFPCDANKEHYAGDEWQEDACTKCSCSKVSGENSAHVSCRRQACAPPVCSQLEDLVTTPARPGHCCAQYMCVLKPKKNCTEAKKMECGFGQVLKQKTTPDGCQEFACECKPASECEPLPNENEVEIMEPGMERVVDNSGCCPRIQFLCQPGTCPQPPACPKFHEAITNNVTGKCCPQTKCEAPKDKCIVTLEWEAASKGGEKSRTTPQTILKDVDSVWLDGPCRSCRCENTSLGAAGRCSVTECPPVVSTDDFVLEPRPVPFQCCPQPVAVACRDGDNIYKVGESWPSATNVCESYKCVATETDGKLDKITTLQQCHTDCQPGSKYFPATSESGECCGQCEPVACVVDGEERPIGDKWVSSDFCANYTCVNLNGTLQVQCSNETCPEVSDAMKKQFVLKEEKVEGKCCPNEEPVACRVGNKIYQEGQTWSSPDPCKNVTCARDVNGRLTHQESVASCSRDCKRGWQYDEPPTGVCCGHCVQTACVVDDNLITPGTTWYSDDNCTTYSCDKAGEEVFVTSSRQFCPDVSHCAPENLVNDTCCQVCEEPAEALSKCVPTSIPAADTIGLLRVHLGPHGLCRNKLPLKGFKECRGTCDSGTIFNNQTGVHDSRCECCQASKYQPLDVSLSCEDGTTQPHRVASPATCACAACGGPDRPLWPTRPGYAGIKSPPRKGGYAEREDIIPDIYQRFGSSPRPRL